MNVGIIFDYLQKGVNQWDVSLKYGHVHKIPTGEGKLAYLITADGHIILSSMTWCWSSLERECQNSWYASWVL